MRTHHRNMTDCRRRLRHARPAAVLAVVLVALVSMASPASAHAEIDSTDPHDGEVLSVAPSVVTMTFTEAVDVQPDSVRVLDANGRRVDTGSARSSGATVTTALPAGLPRGGYVVSWRVLSDDGHPVSGAFRFSVGRGQDVGSDVAASAFGGSSDGRDRWAGRMLQALAYVATLGVAGAVLVGAALAREGEPTPVSMTVGVLAAVGTVAALGQLPFQASLIGGGGLSSVTDPAVLRLALADGFGASMVMVAAGLLAVALTAGIDFSGVVRVTATTGAVIAPAGLVVTGHTRTMTPAVIGYAADLVHVFAGALWFGGLAALTVVLGRRRRAADLVAAGDAVRTFSSMALLSSIAVIASGVVLAWIEVGGPKALVGTDYGRLLLVKVAVVGAVLAGAAWNRFVFIPSLRTAGTDGERSDAGADWPRFRNVLRAETAGLVVVLALTGTLTNLTPARTAVIERGAANHASAPLGDGRVTVTVNPAREGRNEITVAVTDADGTPGTAAAVVAVEMSLPAKSLGPLRFVPVRTAPGRYQVPDADIPLRGRWAVTVRARPDRFSELTASMTVTVR